MTEVAAPPPGLALATETLGRMLGDALAAAALRRGDGISVQDASGRFVHLNARCEEWAGRPAQELIGRTPSDLFDAATAAALRTAEAAALGQQDVLASAHRVDWGAGRREFSVLRSASAPEGTGRPFVVSLWIDLEPQRARETQLRQALEQIERDQHTHAQLRRELAEQAMRDVASGLHSRAHFEDQLRREVDLSTREHREFAIVFIELDPPSEAGRELGPEAEQSVLAAMGRLLRGGTRAMDASCRYEDRRFAILLSGVGLATAHSRMEGLRRRCATEIVVHAGQELRFSVAMGVASFPHTAHTQAELVAACEAALAEARRRGGNHVTLAAIRFDAG